MPVNSIPPSPPVRTTEAATKTDVAAARKQSDLQEQNKVKAQQEAANKQAQIQQTQESGKPSVNTSGQKVGTRINTSA